jgi:threonine dehydratase
LSRCKLLAEGAGAASVAALINARVQLRLKSRVCCVISGGNLDLTRLKSVL